MCSTHKQTKSVDSTAWNLKGSHEQLTELGEKNYGRVAGGEEQGLNK